MGGAVARVRVQHVVQELVFEADHIVLPPGGPSRGPVLQRCVGTGLEVTQLRVPARHEGLDQGGVPAGARGWAVAVRHPSSMVNESPGGNFFVGSSQLAKVLPSKSNRQPATFSWAVIWLSAARAPARTRSAHASAAPRDIFFIPTL